MLAPYTRVIKDDKAAPAEKAPTPEEVLAAALGEGAAPAAPRKTITRPTRVRKSA
jgi:hypothetical protein